MLRFAPIGVECNRYHLPVLTIDFAVIVDGLYAHVALVGQSSRAWRNSVSFAAN